MVKLGVCSAKMMTKIYNIDQFLDAYKKSTISRFVEHATHLLFSFTNSQVEGFKTTPAFAPFR